MAQSQRAHICAHPLEKLDLNSTLALILETEDPFLMPLYRFEEIIEMAAREGLAPELRGYLYGLCDQRRVAIYSGGR
ncbi:hypothetical protein LMG28614_06017 [Paraburkholderia ultramafica]|uniref:Uncharacterized protein n=1 Tax=Paraburkholderia ultramafica TaxID=1544867 RepID=A0A6S7BLT2_9BURK|nr:hypothetical protein [Paraburkholderia ultramafica]CAB3804361.1 hypothetical protein LMG28614_06017 [Paraburkholderia ultramafica]